ncbi:MAG: plasmid pRiA4b ORF-3 family protein [Burkholderiaceae bacterium]
MEDQFVPDQPLKHARCIGGQNACPPDDVGGSPGYQEFLRAIADPNDEEHDSYLTWVGGQFDPAEFNIDDTNALLAEIKV